MRTASFFVSTLIFAAALALTGCESSKQSSHANLTPPFDLDAGFELDDSGTYPLGEVAAVTPSR